MGLKNNLHRWEKEDLIKTTQIDAILAFEKDRKSGRFLRGLYGLGAFSILLGILALVASNWYHIPGGLKIALHLVLNGGAAYALYHFDRIGTDTKRELALLGHTGLTLTLIALIGQVFQLDGTILGALTLWIILTAPAVIALGRSYISVLPWMIGFVGVSYGQSYEIIDDLISDHGDALLVFLPMIVCFPIVLMMFRSVAEKFGRDVFAEIVYFSGHILLIGWATFASFVWYGGDTKGHSLIIALIICVIAAVLVSLVKMPKHAKYLAWSSILMVALPAVILQDVTQSYGYNFSTGYSWAAALTFIAYWLFVGWVGAALQRQSLVSMALVLVAIRIYAIYLEVFGSLMQSGFGLIFSGLVLMGMAWGTHRFHKVLTQTLKIEGDLDE